MEPGSPEGLADRQTGAPCWWRDVGAGYSISRYDNGLDITETGAECWRFTPTWLYARFSKAERGDIADQPISPRRRISDHSALSGEVRRVQKTACS